jgi:hypothetical protein
LARGHSFSRSKALRSVKIRNLELITFFLLPYQRQRHKAHKVMNASKTYLHIPPRYTSLLENPLVPLTDREPTVNEPITENRISYLISFFFVYRALRLLSTNFFDQLLDVMLQSISSPPSEARSPPPARRTDAHRSYTPNSCSYTPNPAV